MFPAKIILADGQVFAGKGLATVRSMEMEYGFVKSPAGQIVFDGFGELDDAITTGSSIEGAVVECYVWHQAGWTLSRWRPVRWPTMETPDNIGAPFTVVYFDGGNPWSEPCPDADELLRLYRRREAFGSDQGAVSEEDARMFKGEEEVLRDMRKIREALGLLEVHSSEPEQAEN